MLYKMGKPTTENLSGQQDVDSWSDTVSSSAPLFEQQYVFMQVCVFTSGLCTVCGPPGLSLASSLSPFSISLSHEVVLFEVQLQDGVFDGCEDEANVLRVGGAGKMGVDDLVAVWVQVHKHLQDELPASLGIPLGA